MNGPNLNLIGTREPTIYGNRTFDHFFAELVDTFKSEVELELQQTNHEGELIDCLQQAHILKKFDGIILNAGGYTHTSVALRDAIAAINIPVVEVHISNIFAREEFRRNSLLSPVCKGTICGFGLKSYELAIRYFI